MVPTTYHNNARNIIQSRSHKKMEIFANRKFLIFCISEVRSAEVNRPNQFNALVYTIKTNLMYTGGVAYFRLTATGDTNTVALNGHIGGITISVYLGAKESIIDIYVIHLI